MIELAPRHKQGLALKTPILPATGIMGFSDAYRRLVPLETLGAFVTNPMTAQPRRGARPPRAVPFPGGLLIHTGLQNPGTAAIIRFHRKRWERSPVPVIAHVVGVNTDEALASVDRLSDIEVVAGIELGLPDSLVLEEAVGIVASVGRACTLPLIVKLPLWKAVDLTRHILELDSVDALTVAAPPRGAIRHRGQTITGRLYGPATLPLSLWVLGQVASCTNGALPLIGCGGIYSVEDAMAMLEAGAAAVQVDSYIWRDPQGFTQMAQTLGNLNTKNGAAM
jgi:dihydroorotate dehydrogenase (NAD+) catalytic subunit